MSANPHNARRVSIKAALMPMLWFAPVIATISWAAAYVFRDHFDLMATLIGIGCAPIVVALCAYLYVLVNSVRD
jgi:hypothetical protein